MATPPDVALKRLGQIKGSGATWGPMAWIANDTQSSHVAKKDHIVMGMAIHDPKSATSFLFYTACACCLLLPVPTVLRGVLPAQATRSACTRRPT